MRALTLGTAGHVDHGKTALVGALTGVQTDRLEEERRRGISIELGYAPLVLPSGRRMSVVDVPGHERLVRTMVAGATGIDRFLLVVAADDGVMPQTREHLAVLRALAVPEGLVAVTKADLADPGRAAAEAAELLPGVPVVACSARTGAGLDELRAALERLAPGEAVTDDGPVVLHVDRAFTIRGAGTVVTGTLWSGTIGAGDRLVLEPGARDARVRAVQVHDAPAERAAAGQRVAVNLAGVARDEVARGDVLASPGAVAPARVLHLALDLAGEPRGRVHLHHGTRHTPARLSPRPDGTVRARLERPLLARAGDRVVVRSVAPPDTLGGGLVLRETGSGTSSQRGKKSPTPFPGPAPGLDAAALALEARLRAAGHEPVPGRELDQAALAALREHGRAVRLGRDRWAHAEAAAAVRAVVERLAAEQDGVALADLRDALGTGRATAQAWLEHLDAAKVTRRRPDDRRVLRRR